MSFSARRVAISSVFFLEPRRLYPIQPFLSNDSSLICNALKRRSSNFDSRVLWLTSTRLSPGIAVKGLNRCDQLP